MAFASNAAHHDNVAEINITPLVGVMLVLLVIFMIATPIVTQRIGMDLPGAAPPQARTEPPLPINLRIDGAGMPTLQIDASDDADYGALARVLAAARNADWPQVGFVRG